MKLKYSIYITSFGLRKLFNNPYVIVFAMKNYFGGEHLLKKRKTQRPLDFKKTTHLVLRLKPLLPSLLDPRDQNLRKGFQKLATKYNIRVYQLVFNHTHLHAAILIPNREAYVAFIKELTSKLVNYFIKKTGVKLSKIFLHRPFTRIVNWGRGLRNLYNYFLKNENESGIQQFCFRKREIRIKEKCLRLSLGEQVLLFDQS